MQGVHGRGGEWTTSSSVTAALVSFIRYKIRVVTLHSHRTGLA